MRRGGNPVWEAIARYKEARDGKAPPDKAYRIPNRAMRRAMRFGGSHELGESSSGGVVVIRPNRSRIQRGISRPGQRGAIVRNGIHAILVDEDGNRTDMAEFHEGLEAA